jgi:hypothetical protein
VAPCGTVSPGTRYTPRVVCTSSPFRDSWNIGTILEVVNRTRQNGEWHREQQQQLLQQQRQDQQHGYDGGRGSISVPDPSIYDSSSSGSMVSSTTREYINSNGVSAREGHLACVLGSSTKKNNRQRICFTGGFTQDDAVYVLHVPPPPPPPSAQRRRSSRSAAVSSSMSSSSSSSAAAAAASGSWTWQRVMPTLPSIGFVRFAYGASLTTLDESRAIRFGGFRSGGYFNESDQVALLTVTEENVQQPLDGTTTPTATTNATSGKQLQAEYRVMNITNPLFGIGRAYHTSTLLNGRYLLVLGGMVSNNGSILEESILDTRTWTWIEQPITTTANTRSGIATTTDNQESCSRPSGRHGHSVILDHRRHRLVLFGGGSGSDLLRSGIDNSEVWELDMGTKKNGLWKTDLVQSLPWIWRKIHDDVVGSSELVVTNQYSDDGGGGGGNDPLDSKVTKLGPSSSKQYPQRLSRAEALSMGRCHNAIHVAPDTVVFVFGAGRPSTNGVLGYDLATDSFVRPRVQGPLPRPRHSGVAVFLPNEGYLLVHGGYTMQLGSSVEDMGLLDLAPSLGRNFGQWPLDTTTQQESFEATTNEDACADTYMFPMHRRRRRRQGITIGAPVFAETEAGRADHEEEDEGQDVRRAMGRFWARDVFRSFFRVPSSTSRQEDGTTGGEGS